MGGWKGSIEDGLKGVLRITYSNEKLVCAKPLLANNITIFQSIHKLIFKHNWSLGGFD